MRGVVTACVPDNHYSSKRSVVTVSVSLKAFGILAYNLLLLVYLGMLMVKPFVVRVNFFDLAWVADHATEGPYHCY
jgi:hypothetical protein